MNDLQPVDFPVGLVVSVALALIGFGALLTWLGRRRRS